MVHHHHLKAVKEKGKLKPTRRISLVLSAWMTMSNLIL